MYDIMEETLRLYSRTDKGLEFVWLFGFEEHGLIFIDEGTVGEMSERRTFPLDQKSDVDAEIEQLRSKGFAEFDEDNMTFMDIVFDVKDDFADDAELEKRNALMDDLDEFLALTGQGWVDGASSGMGTMEVGLLVVDAGIAKSTIAKWLMGTDWKDYKSITTLNND